MTAYESAAKPYKGMGMEGAVARWYASLTRKSLDEFAALAGRISGQLASGADVLEVAPGPGYFAIELAKRGDYRISGLDISRTFVEIARTNAAKARVEIDFRQGDAAKMPFADTTFDFLLCRAAFKNFSRPAGALEEMHRVLKPGGEALIIDLRRDASMESIRQGVKEMRLTAMNAVITRLTFRWMLLRRAYTKGEFEQMIAGTTFRSGEIRLSPIGLEVWLRRSSRD
jgi:ubiquinone/menaquinone biosynthesis C-methylase UbiE